MRVLLIVNPCASSVTGRARRRVVATLGSNHQLTELESLRRGHAIDLARDRAGSFDAVAVLGGDGTVSEVATGLAARDHAAILVPLPGGSTNVFARTAGLPSDLPEATAAVRGALNRGSIRQLSLGSVDGRCVLFHVGVGFDAAVVARVERHAGLKRRLGQPVFVYDALATWLRRYDRRRARFAVRLPDGSSIEDAYHAIALNSDPYTYLGRRPLSLAPGAGERGMAVITVRSAALAPMVGLFAGALLGIGRLARPPGVDVRTDLASLTVTGHRPFPYQVDGDYLGETNELSIRHDAHRLRLIDVRP